MKAVCLDGYCENPGDLSWDPIAKHVDEFVYYDRTEKKNDIIIERIGDADVVVTNKTPLPAAVLEKCPNVKIVLCISTGYSIVDIDYCKAHGIPVCNVPVYGTMAVSEFAMALLLEIAHHIGHHNDTVHAGKWENHIDFCYWDYPLFELDQMTMGIIGLGNIGRHTAEMAKAFGMNVIAYDPWQNDAGRAVATYVELEELYKKADVIVLHMPLLDWNTNLICKESIAKMKDGVIIINVSRGKMVNDYDLAEALKSGKVRAAGLDVVSTEPIQADDPLKECENAIITPHMAWGSIGCRGKIMNTAGANLEGFLAGKRGKDINCVYPVD